MYFRTSFTWEAENTPYLEVQYGGLEERTREKRVSVELLIPLDVVGIVRNRSSLSRKVKEWFLLSGTLAHREGLGAQSRLE